MIENLKARQVIAFMVFVPGFLKRNIFIFGSSREIIFKRTRR